MSRSDKATLADLVAECLSRIEGGETDLPFPEICASAPELIDEVRRTVTLAGALPDRFLSGAPKDRMEGALVAGRYRLMRRIGAGAMGVVYLGLDLELEREVAVKIVRTQLAENESAYARFDREAAALVAIRHESIVSIFDRGVTEDHEPFLVMEYVDGVSCADLLEMAPERAAGDSTAWLLTTAGLHATADPSFIRQSIRWMSRVADGVAAAHKAGIYHRDIKPSNIMIRRDGTPVLLDFGIAVQEDDVSLTRTGAAVGTPAYMAPEALHGRPEALAQVDVYGLTATLYQLLTLQPPYAGSSAEVLAALATREPVPAAKLRPGLPRDMQAILDNGMARRPAARYSTALHLRSDLAALLAFEPVSVRPTSMVRRIARRSLRSRAFLGALTATAVFAGWIGMQAWAVRSARLAKERFEPAYCALPANLGVVRASNRDVPVADARADIERSLGELVDSGHDHVVALALRACFRWDQGDRNLAVEDARAFAQAAGTDYARALADRYASGAESSSLAIALDDLPEPSSRWDSYLAGLHLLRAKGRAGQAFGFFQDERLDDVRHVADIRFIFAVASLKKLDVPGREDELYQAAESIIREIRQFEALDGYRSPITAQALGSALLRQDKYHEVVDVCSSGLAMAPWSLVLLQNLGMGYFQAGELDKGREAYEAALRLAPGYSTLLAMLANLEAREGHAERARQLAADCTFPDTPKGANAQAILDLEVEVHLALQASSPPDPSAEASEPIAESLDLAIERALEASTRLPKDSPARDRLMPIVVAIQEDDPMGIAAAMMPDLMEHPLDLTRLQLVLSRLPEKGDARLYSLLRDWMQRSHESLIRSAVAQGTVTGS